MDGHIFFFFFASYIEKSLIHYILITFCFVLNKRQNHPINNNTSYKIFTFRKNYVLRL